MVAIVVLLCLSIEPDANGIVLLNNGKDMKIVDRIDMNDINDLLIRQSTLNLPRSATSSGSQYSSNVTSQSNTNIQVSLTVDTISIINTTNTVQHNQSQSVSTSRSPSHVGIVVSVVLVVFVIYVILVKLYYHQLIHQQIQ